MYNGLLGMPRVSCSYDLVQRFSPTIMASSCFNPKGQAPENALLRGGERMIPTMNCWANGHGLPLLQDDCWTYMHSLYTLHVHTHIFLMFFK